eukprot:7633764-Pyramimonas_sp.AAC.1
MDENKTVSDRDVQQSDSIGQDTREDTRPFRGPQRHRNVGIMGRETQDTRVPLMWQGRVDLLLWAD